ncbi:Hypothetical predicted protein [Paramuricea clavata]|uniref:Uncharacterized protein n=1 Tax=Paramuricea clavata TaxID=317549 RepID=A0A6S7K886_PARCT|nr:Hypothetical predicted protein [Paramuricea clavata]
MAAAPKSAIKRTIHSPGFFCALNTQSTADFYLPRKRTRKTLGGGQLYSVERVIASRTSKEECCVERSQSAQSGCSPVTKQPTDKITNDRGVPSGCFFLFVYGKGDKTWTLVSAREKRF